MTTERHSDEVPPRRRPARSILAAGVVLVLTALAQVARGESPAPVGADATPLAVYRVDHDHAVGSGRGELVITRTGFEYCGASADEARHSRVWRDDDVKRIGIERKKITLTVYEAGSVPLVPRQVPFVKNTVAIPAGVEHRFEFHLRGDAVSSDVARAIEARFPRPIATTVVPSDDASLGHLVFESDVFHRHHVGGQSGTLRVYEHRVLFVAADESESRAWRYTDVRSISRLGDRRFAITTYDGQFGPGGKDYVFDLKRPITDGEYDALWNLVYGARGGSP